MQDLPSHQLNAASLLQNLGTRRVGRRIIVLPEVDSTNSYVLDTLAVEEGKAADGCVVFAEYQNAGRGRLGRAWHSPRGASLIFTLLLCADGPRPTPARLVMAASVAVAAGIEQTTEVEPVIRWPNDVYVGDKKLAGILVEVRMVGGTDHATAVGIGVNCLQQAGHFSPELRDRATSLELEASHPVDRLTVARAILRRLDAYIADGSGVSNDQLTADWRARSADVGAYVTLTSHGQTFTGRIVDVHPQTGLLLQLDTGARREFDPATTVRR
ncbi:MAG: biotin--[acetyl-CoA-carboxylase] ligase [Phycisphaerae bacterium]|nr:biotin--[acetyl-CoA-carboxylase] ligase [Phycisphaerae bacterium]